jgi:phospholipid N-methyltransferase
MTTHGRLRLLALRDQTDAAGEDMARQRERFTALAGREAVRAISSFQLFQTPETIADMMAATANPQDGERWLEPSAGLGRLYRALRYRSAAHVTLVEQAPQCAAELYRETQGDSEATLIEGDFLQCTAERLGGLFDGILMNSPFKNATDKKHIAHALTLLKPQGRIVALCYAGPRQRAAFENRNGWTWRGLEAGAFRSEGTGAAVAMITKTNGAR